MIGERLWLVCVVCTLAGAASCYLKVNAPPYLFSCDLHGEIDDGACVATVTSEGVEFTCAKASVGQRWGRLKREVTAATKAEVTARRARSVEAAHARVVAERAAAREAKKKAEKAYLEKQWEMEQNRRKTIEERQDAEMEAERERIRLWQEKTDRQAAGLDPDVESEDDEVDYDSDDDAETRALKEARTRVAREREFAAKILTPDAVAAAEGDVGVDEGTKISEEDLDRMLLEEDDENVGGNVAHGGKDASGAGDGSRPAATPKPKKKVVVKLERRELPPPRASVNVTVDFTKLETDHMPARETREKEIREWKRQQAALGAPGLAGDKADRGDITEREPIFLKDKGDAFFKAGNYRSALEAYSRAVETESQAPHPDGTLVRLLANRAACYLKGGDPEAAADDCTAALDLLESEELDTDTGTLWTPEACRAQRVKLLVRRGKARAAANHLDLAAEDLGAASKLAPGNEGIARDLEEVRHCAAPLDANGLRARGDARYRAGDVAGAMEAYGAVLALGRCTGRERAAALANRAACHLSRSDHGAAHDDCEEGLDALLAPLGAGTDGEPTWRAGNACSAADVAAGGDEGWDEECVALLAKLLHRRGAAAAHLRRYAAAADDYGAAARLVPADAAAALEADVATVRELAARHASGDAGSNSYDDRWDRIDAEATSAATSAAASAAACAAALDTRPVPGCQTTFATVRRGAPGAAAVEKGDDVEVHASGHVEAGGMKFWSTRDAGQSPFTYRACAGEVIRGWDHGMLGATVGETRRLRIPAEEGYGALGFPAWGIPPGADLLFEIEVLDVRGK